MTDALAKCDAYVVREAGPPGRAEVRVLTDRLRHLEPSYAAALERERVLLGQLGEVQLQLELVRIRHGERTRQAHAAHDALRAARLRVQELETAALLADEMLGERASRTLLASWMEIIGFCALGFGAGWIGRG